MFCSRYIKFCFSLRTVRCLRRRTKSFMWWVLLPSSSCRVFVLYWWVASFFLCVCVFIPSLSSHTAPQTQKLKDDNNESPQHILQYVCKCACCVLAKRWKDICLLNTKLPANKWLAYFSIKTGGKWNNSPGSVQSSKTQISAKHSNIPTPKMIVFPFLFVFVCVLSNKNKICVHFIPVQVLVG